MKKFNHKKALGTLMGVIFTICLVVGFLLSPLLITSFPKTCFSVICVLILTLVYVNGGVE